MHWWSMDSSSLSNPKVMGSNAVVHQRVFLPKTYLHYAICFWTELELVKQNIVRKRTCRKIEIV